MTRKVEMYALIAEQQSSGMSQAAFCRMRGFSVATFQYWRTKLDQESRGESELPLRFVPLNIEPSKQDQLEIVFPNGVKVSGFGLNTDLLVRVAQSWR